MAAKTTSAPVAENEDRVRIFIPFNEEELAGVKMDPYEHVTINGETTLIKRGEYVEVKPEVFIQLRNKYPHL